MTIKHKCTVLDYCIFGKDHKILFCVFCRTVVGYEKDGKRVISPNTHKLYSEKTINDSV